MERQPARVLASYVPAALGLAFGTFFVFTSDYKDSPLWIVWAPLLVGTTTAAGAVFRYGLNRWPELTRYRTAGVRDVMPRVLLIFGVSVLALWLTAFLPTPRDVRWWRHPALLSVLLLGGVPAAAVVEGIRRTADAGLASDTRGRQLVALLTLQRLLQRLLAALGSVVAISTLTVGASWRLEQDLAKGSGSGLPSQFVLIFGGAGSLLVALPYVPAATALQRLGLHLCDGLFPLGEANEAPAVLDAAENRRKIEQILGVDSGIFAELQTGLAILGPLLASAAAAFLTPR